MPTQALRTRKITVSIPPHLVDFADRTAKATKTSRSQIISEALARTQAKEQEQLAAEGYQFYAAEADEFAIASAVAVAEAISDER
jgi:metal-responsive CopG/Arc/MetJ family transcriptional regulator